MLLEPADLGAQDIGLPEAHYAALRTHDGVEQDHRAKTAGRSTRSHHQKIVGRAERSVDLFGAVAHDGVAVDERDVRAFLRGRIAAYKIPRRVLFFDEDELSVARGSSPTRKIASAGWGG